MTCQQYSEEKRLMVKKIVVFFWNTCKKKKVRFKGINDATYAERFGTISVKRVHNFKEK